MTFLRLVGRSRNEELCSTLVSPVPHITTRWDRRDERYCLLGFACSKRILVIVVLVGIWKDNGEPRKHIYSMITTEFDCI